MDPDFGHYIWPPPRDRSTKTTQGQTQHVAEEISKQNGQRTMSDMSTSHLTVPLAKVVSSLSFQANVERAM